MVISYCLRAGGAETVINNLCNGLRKIGYNIAIGAIFFLPNPPDNIEKANRRNLEVSHLTILVDIILILFIIIIQHELLFTANIKTFCISLSRIIKPNTRNQLKNVNTSLQKSVIKDYISFKYSFKPLKKIQLVNVFFQDSLICYLSASRYPQFDRKT